VVASLPQRGVTEPGPKMGASRAAFGPARAAARKSRLPRPPGGPIPDPDPGLRRAGARRPQQKIAQHRHPGFPRQARGPEAGQRSPRVSDSDARFRAAVDVARAVGGRLRTDGQRTERKRRHRVGSLSRTVGGGGGGGARGVSRQRRWETGVSVGRATSPDRRNRRAASGRWQRAVAAGRPAPTKRSRSCSTATRRRSTGLQPGAAQRPHLAGPDGAAPDDRAGRQRVDVRLQSTT
jgi:hypothetical protein